MNRQEAIAYLMQHKYPNTCGQKSLEESNEAIDIAIKALQGDMYCPSCGVRLVSENEYVEPKPFNWRTDNPPEERDKYFVTYDNGCIDICRWTNENRFWSNETTDWHWRSALHCKVVAWKPLPKPYNVESEDNE